MSTDGKVQTVQIEIGKGIGLAKCQKCGCMRETLDNFAALLPKLGTEEANALLERVRAWDKQMTPVQYACLGCVYCYPAVAQNAFAAAFPSADQSPVLACDFRPTSGWPAVVGEYFVIDKVMDKVIDKVADEPAYVAISTLGSISLAQELADARPRALAIVGKTETENIGIDKVVKNIITNPGIQYLVLAGKETEGHLSGRTLLALKENGIDANGRVVGSPGKRPILRNVSAEEIEAFREQVQLIDLIGCEDLAEIRARVEALSPKEPEPCG
jgi:tetrahydromethanopterin S-methyltransferase subunit A